MLQKKMLTLNNEFTKELIFVIMRGIRETGSYKITGLGQFSIKDVPERQGRHPRTGETITFKAKKKIVFKISGVLKSAVFAEEL